MDCSICFEPIVPNEWGWDQGNNAVPYNDGRCCDECNTTKVIPARIWILKRKKQGTFNGKED